MVIRSLIALGIAITLSGCARPVDYVASQKSQVFHKSTCSEAGHIQSQNLVHFKDRAQAAQDHRACDVCKP